MAEALVRIAAEGILERVLSLATSEIVLAWGYEEKLADLHRTLELISAKLRDSEKQKGTEAVMVWLKQLKHVVGEANDVLDEIHYEKLRREVKKRDLMARKVSTLPSFKKLSFRLEMGHKIEDVSKKLFEINKQANDLGLQNEQPGVFPNSLFRETDPYLEEFKVVGRESDELHIVQLLTKSRKEEKLTIVPIVGMGGIGKTTLAKSIYNNSSIEQHFDVKVWLCVSVKVEVVEKLLAKIYESLAGEECKSEMRANLITSLQNKLGSKRYLIVLDDVWDEDGGFWDDFKTCMLKVNSKSGSGILVTTRSLQIGTKSMSEDFHALQSLTDDRCWCIFKERAFVVGRSPLPELEEIGRDIVKKCRGLPLLVNVIGGVLRNCNDKEKWLSIKDSKVWDLEEEGNRVQNTLRLSFDNLPNSTVKQCFLYCSIYKKDTVLKREELMRLWMALGLAQADERKNKEAEDVGNDIFQILVSSSLIQDVKVDEDYGVTACMHDLVHDLSLSLCKHESLCLVDPTIDDMAHIPLVKHLAILSKDEWIGSDIDLNILIPVVFKNEMIARTLHTFILDGVAGVMNISFQSFKNLRILKLKGHGVKKINNSIGEFVHLRYLDLSFSQVNVLPKSIAKLYHLQTLNLIGCNIKKFPRDMSNLISLRHLMYIGEHHILLVEIRYIKLKTEELGRLKHLAGEICITNLENIRSKEDAIKADLYGKKKLNRIKFHWSWDSKKDVNRNDKDVLEGLQPPGKLKNLTIENFSGDHFPTWVMKMAVKIERKWEPLHNIVNIKLYRCRSCIYLPVLECLPLLENLVLVGMDNLTSLSSSLNKGSLKPLSPSLRSLDLIHMKRLESWIDASTPNSSTMLSPVLKNLYIANCPKLVNLDECHPHPLVSLTILDCESFMSIKSIQGLTSLQDLHIGGCPRLLEIPYLQNYEHHPLKTMKIYGFMTPTSMPCEIFDCFSFLNTLQLGPFSKELHSFPSLKGIEKLRNHLRLLKLYGWHHWKSIPEEIKHLTSLTQLKISGFGVSELPMWLTNMSSIQVDIYDNTIPILTRSLNQIP
ncbi:hypothetical protein LXL04_026766 [Taraxacum kok-saghyz]